MNESYNISHLKITEEEIERNGVSALRNTPNRGSHFGTNDLSASELKARFDQLPKLIIKRFNELLGALAEGKVEFSVEGIPSLSALATSIRDGALGAILTVAPGDERTLAELAIDLDTLSTALEEANTTLATKAEGEALEAFEADLRRALLSLETKAEESAVQNAVDSLSKRVASKVEGSTLTEVVTSIEAELTALQNSLYKKANASDVNTALSRMESSLAGKANAADVSADVAGLRDALAKKATAANVDAALAERDAEIAKKADKSYVDSQLTGKVAQSDFNAALAARDTEIGKKADISALGALNTEITRLGTSIGGKADAKDTAEALALKADKTAVEAALKDKADKADVDEAVAELEKTLGKKADVTAVDAALEAKADKSAVEADLAKKADATTVETMLAEIRTALDGKGDGAAIDAALDEIRSALETKTDGEAVTALIVAEVAKVVGTTKDALDTLEELGKALGDDPNFAATVNAKLAELRTALESKADASDVVRLREDLAKKADAATVEAQLAEKANVAEIEQALAGKADASELTKKADAADVAELREDLSKKADAATVEVQLAEKADAADVTAALAGKADASELAKKANAADVTAALAAQVDEIEKKANAADVTAALAGKADASELAKKADASDVTAALEARDAEIEKKANASDVVTELEDIRTVLRGKASATSLDNAIKNFDEAATALWDSVGNKVDASTLAEKEASLRSAIGAKADAATVEELSNALAGKASLGALALKANASDIEELNAALAEKADVADLNEALAGKADRSEIDEQVNAKVAEIVGSSAEALNTLEELGAALGNDPNFAASVTESIGKKANASDVKTALAEKVDAVDLETKLGQVNAAIVAKANASYVETELTKRDTEIAKKANASYVAEELALRDREIAKKANAADMETALAKKANTSTVEAELEEIIATLAKKASISYVEAEIEKSNLEIAKKAGATAVNAAIEEINAELKKKASVTSVDSALEAIRTALDGKADRQTVEAAMAEIRAALDTKTDNEAVAELVVTEVAKVVGSTKDALDTLEELAAALGNDENFAATVNAKLAELRAALDTKADKTDIEAALEEKADAAAVNAALAEKANASELAGKVDAADIENALAERDAAIVAKANASYVETELAKRDTEIAKKANASYVAEELALRDSEIAKKANADNMETALAKKANTSTVEAELEEINSALLAKADAATVEAALAVRDAEIALKATTAYVDEQLATRDAEIENKASRSYVNGNIERLRFDVDAYYYPKVSRLEKKVKNLEEAVNPECTIVDDSVAYIKEIPFGALPYAEITEIGGRIAHPAKNLFDASKFHYQTDFVSSAEGSGDHISFRTGDRTGSALVEWTKTGECGGEVSPLTDFFNVEVGRKYTIACSAYHNGEPFSGGRVIFEGGEGGGYVSVMSGERATITMTKETADGGIMVGSEYDELLGNDVYEFEFEIKIELYDAEALSLGITETTPVRVQELEIIGRNRMPTQYPLLTSETTSPERVTFTPMPDGSIVLNGTATNGISFFLFGNESEGKGGGEFRLEPGSYVIGGGLKSASVVMKVDGTHIKSGVLSVTAKDDYHDLGYVVYIYIPKGAQFDNAVIHPYLLKGEDVPSEIPAYSCTLLSLSPLYGSSISGYSGSDAETMEYTGLSWFGYGNETIYNRVVWDESGQASYIFAIKENSDVSPPEDLLIDPPRESPIYYHDDVEPIDNLIEVEGGGKITALNALGKQLPVPFTVVFQKDPYYVEGGEE